MKKTVRKVYVGASLLALVGCAMNAHTTIMPMEDSTYQAISTSRSGQDALDDNVKKASETCQKQGKSYAVVSQNNYYQGVDPNLKKMANMASDVAFFSKSGAFVPTHSLSSDDDYKVVTVFRCK